MTRFKKWIPRITELENRETPATLSAVGGGFGETSRVQVFDVDTRAVVGDFLAFGPDFRGGVSVALGDVNLDGQQDVIVAAGRGGGPRVRVFDGRAFIDASNFNQAPTDGSVISANTSIADFFAFEATQRGGSFVTAGDISGSANADIIIGAGTGGGPRVRVFDGAAITNAQGAFRPDDGFGVTADFFAGDQSARSGVVVAMGGNAGSPFLATSSGPGGNSNIRVLNANAIRQQGSAFNFGNSANTIANFSVGNPNNTDGAFISSLDFNNDGFNDLSVLNGGNVNVFDGTAFQNQGPGFTGLGINDSLNTFNIPAGNLVNNGFSNFGTTGQFGGFGGFNNFGGFGGFNNRFGVPFVNTANGAFGINQGGVGNGNNLAFTGSNFGTTGNFGSGIAGNTNNNFGSFNNLLGVGANPTAGLGNSFVTGPGNSFTGSGSFNTGFNPSNTNFSTGLSGINSQANGGGFFGTNNGTFVG